MKKEHLAVISAVSLPLFALPLAALEKPPASLGFVAKATHPKRDKVSPSSSDQNLRETLEMNFADWDEDKASPLPPPSTPHCRRTTMPEGTVVESPTGIEVCLEMELPMEYLSASLLLAEQLSYDDGTSESRYVLDVGLGQEKILVVEHFDPAGQYMGSDICSAERLSAYVPESFFSDVVSALAASCFEVNIDKYGLPIVEVRLDPETPDYFLRRLLFEQTIGARGQMLMLSPASVQSHSTFMEASVTQSASRASLSDL